MSWTARTGSWWPERRLAARLTCWRLAHYGDARPADRHALGRSSETLR
jgi:hypothetical protein